MCRGPRTDNLYAADCDANRCLSRHRRLHGPVPEEGCDCDHASLQIRACGGLCGAVQEDEEEEYARVRRHISARSKSRREEREP